MMIHNGKSIAKILRGNRAISKIIRAGQYIWQSVKYLFGYDIGGNAVVWNQLFGFGSTSNDEVWDETPNGTFTINKTFSTLATSYDNSGLYTMPRAGHKVLYYANCLSGTFADGASVSVFARFTSDVSRLGTLSDAGQSIQIIATQAEGSYLTYRDFSVGTYTNVRIAVGCIDLTQMFGAGNEPTTYADFLARKPKVKDEYAYNPGKILGVGDEFAWNQLVQNGDFSNGTSGWALQNCTADNSSPNYLKLTPTTNALAIYKNPPTIAGHKVLLVFRLRVNLSAGVYYFDGTLVNGYGDNEFHTFSLIKTANNANAFFTIYRHSNNVGGDDEIFYIDKKCGIQLFDLTAIEQAMGITINSLEDFKTYLKSHSMMDKDATEIPYFGYDAGSVKTSLPIVALQGYGKVKLKDIPYWSYNASFGGFIGNLDATTQPPKIGYSAICAKYPFVGAYSKVQDFQSGYIFNQRLLVKDSSYGTDVNAFLASLTDNDVLYYELASATEVSKTTYPLVLSSPLYNTDVAKFGAGVTRKMGKKVFDGTEGWTVMKASAAAPGKEGWLAISPIIPDMKPMAECFTASYVFKKVVWYESNIGEMSHQNSTSLNVTILEGNEYTSATWKAHLAELYAQGNPLTIIYELATPITESIDLPKIVDYQPTILTTDTEVVGECKAFSTIEEELADQWGVSVDKVGKVDLGTMSWEVLTASRGECRTIDYIPNAASRTPNTSINNDWVCRFSNDDKSFYIFGQHQIVFNDLRFANKTASEVKASLNGVILYYEKA